MIQKLIDLCLDTIVDNFFRYNYVFQTTKDETLKREFEFLQKKYSFELISRLTPEERFAFRPLKEDYLDLLINRHLRVLDAAWFSNCTWEKVTSKIAEVGSNVETLVLRNMLYEDGRIFLCLLDCGDIRTTIQWQDLLCHFPKLKSFTFRDVCDNEILQNIAKFCPDIEEIDVRFSRRNIFSSVENICKNENGEALCTKLKNILCRNFMDLIGGFISINNLKYLLKNLPSLEVIEALSLPYALYSMHKSNFDKAKPYKISELDFSRCESHDEYDDEYDHDSIRKVCFSVCPHVKSLHFNVHHKDNLNSYSSLTGIEEIYMKNKSFSERININEFLKSIGSRLTNLCLEKFSVSVSVIAENCPFIKYMIFDKVHFLVEDNSQPVFPSLVSLSFAIYDFSRNVEAGNSFSSYKQSDVIGVISMLQSTVKLEELTFAACSSLDKTTDIKTAFLKCCKSSPIKKIDFTFSAVELKFVEDILLSCPFLRKLCITSYREFLRTGEAAVADAQLLEFAEGLPNKPCIDIKTSVPDDYLDYESDNSFSDGSEYSNENTNVARRIPLFGF